MGSEEDGSVCSDGGRQSSVDSNVLENNVNNDVVDSLQSAAEEEETKSALSRWNEEFECLLDENPELASDFDNSDMYEP